MAAHNKSSSISLPSQPLSAVPRFSRENFNIWKFQAINYLISLGLWDNVKLKVPAQGDEIKWRADCERARALVCMALDITQVSKVMDCYSVQGIFGVLEAEFAAKSNANKVVLKGQLYSFKMGDDMRAGVDVFYKLVGDLRGVGVKIEDEDLAVILLNSLPDSRDSLKQGLFLVEALSLDKVKAAIFNNSSFSGVAVKTEGAFAAFHGNNKRYEPLTCHECGKVGHKKDRCWLVVGYPVGHPAHKDGKQGRARGEDVHMGVAGDNLFF